MKNKTGVKKGTDDPKALENCDGNVDSGCFWVVCPFFAEAGTCVSGMCESRNSRFHGYYSPQGS